MTETTKKPRLTRRQFRKHREKYLLMLPFMVLFLFFTVIPVFMSIALSFTDFNLLEMPHFVGWENYMKLFLEDSVFIIAAKNTLIFACVTGVLGYFACLLLAWLVNEFTVGVRTALTFLFYAPSIAGNLYVIWNYIFSGDLYGMLNGWLMNLGIIEQPIAWLNDSKYMLGVIMLVQMWMSFGTGFLSFIAGFQGIDNSMYEAGAIDGIRSRWQELFYLTLPCMGPQLMFGAVMQISTSFAAGRICISLAGNPSTDYAASTIITHIIDYGTLRYEMGYASAIATILFIAMLLTNNVVTKILSRHSA